MESSTRPRVLERDAGGSLRKINDYEFIRELGHGDQAEVSLCQRWTAGEKDPQLVAAKVYDFQIYRRRRRQNAFASFRRNPAALSQRQLFRSVTEDDIMTKAQREIAILKKASHPNVAKLIEVISDMEGEMLFVAMEYIDGSAVMQWDGDREAYLAVASDGAFASHVASNLGQQLLQGLEYLHRHRVAHRDLKPDNLILSSSGRLVIVDFGVSCIFEEEVASGQVKNCVSSGTGGALAFRAPEIFSLHQSEHISYDAFKADIWAAGVCLWAFFFAKLPFYSPDPVELRRQILEDPLNYPTPPQSMCSFLTTLLESLLQRDPSCRASAEQGMLHPCFSECFKNPDDLPQDSNQVVAISEVDLAGAIKRVNHLALISMVRYRMRRRLLEARQVLSERHLAEVRLSKTAVEPPKKVKRGPPMEAWTNSSIGRRSLSESEIIIERTRPQAPAGDNGCLVS